MTASEQSAINGNAAVPQPRRSDNFRPPTPSRRALIVEDDETVADIIRRTLRLIGIHTIHLAGPRRRAPEYLDRFCQPDSLIVLDLTLVHQDAAALLRRLVARRFRGDLILVSGSDQRELDAVRVTAQRRGIRVIGAFVKPFSVYRMRSALEQSGR